MFFDKLVLILLCSSSALLSNLVISAEIYKWIDSQGTVHFGDKPHNNPATVYNVPKNNTSNISTTNKNRAKKQQKLLDSFAAERRLTKQQQAEKRKKSNNKKYNCKVSQDRLRWFNNAARIYTRNDVGEKTYLNDTQRQQELHDLNQQITKWCD